MRAVVRISPKTHQKVRASGNTTYSVRWTVNGKEFSKSLPDARQAATYRFELETALRSGVEFDARTGLPAATVGGDVTFVEWAINYFVKEWNDLAPRTRDTYVEDLSRWIAAVHVARAPEPPAGMWAHLYSVLIPVGVECRLKKVPSLACAAWLTKWSPPLADLDPAMMDAAEVRLRTRPDGTPRSAGTLTKWRRGARTVINEAVRLGVLDGSPWPASKRGRRKSTRSSASMAVSPTHLPAVATWPHLLAAMVSHQPASWMYRTMTAIGLYAGLRPSETVELTVEDLFLPKTGWGTFRVDRAWDGYKLPGDPKTTKRVVQIPPVLVAELQSWLARSGVSTGPLFRTSEQRRPSQSNWSRSLRRATKALDIPAITPYDTRHACASTAVGNGVPAAEVAEWLGHSVQTLTKTYLHSMPGDTSRAQRIMDAVYTSAAE